MLICDEKQREVQVHGQQSEATLFSAKQQFTAPRSYPEKRVFTDHNKGSLFCTYCKKKNHVVDNFYRLIGFPADFKFTKSKKFGTTARSNAALSTEEGDSQSNNSGDKAMTQDQYLNLCQLLQHVKIGSQGELVPSDNVIANCAGISDTFPYTNSYLSVSIGHISWILDSGASDHITSDPTLLFNIQTLSKPILINLPNLLNVKVFQTGSVTILPDYTLHHVLFVPSFKYNLLSVHKLCAQFNSIMIFSSLHAILQAPSMKRPLVLGRVSKGLYLLHTSKQIKPRAQDLSSNRIFAFSLCNQLINQWSKFVPVLANVNSDVTLWHNRLGHLPFSNMKFIPNIASIFPDSSRICDICANSRQTRTTFPSSSISSKKIFDLIHVDTWGPYKTPTHNGFKYFLTIVDDFSRGTWTFLLSTKANASTILKHFFAMIERQFQTTVKILRSDNALELGSSKETSLFLAEKGIIHQTSCFSSPQQNGVVEQKHRHLLETCRALLFQSNLPTQYWGECLMHATFLIKFSI